MPQRPETSAAAPIEILAVDDDERNLLALDAVLDGLDVKVVKARSGAEALRLLLRRVYPLIILDVQMPGIDGFETAKLIREAPQTRHVPIIFLTANVDADRAALGYAQGAVDYLFKPIVPEVLRAKVSVFAELHRAKDRERELVMREERRRWEAEALAEKLRQERAAAVKLEEALAQTRETLAMRERFIRMASHELRTPLTSMILAIQNALRRADHLTGDVGSRMLHTLKVLAGQMERLSKLVEKLMSATVIQAGKLRLSRAETDLHALTLEVVEELGHSIEAAGCAVTVASGGPVVVPVDPFWVQQVVSNLVTNALKFGGGKPVRITVGTTGDRARIVVQDEGIGISPEDQPRIFEPFEHAAGAENYGGMGLGLYIVKHIVEEHGGHLGVESAPGQGATFVVALPLQVP